MEQFLPREGALRYKDPDTGEWHSANPGDTMYSTVTMVASEFWTRATGWVPIFSDTEGGDVG